MSEDNKPICLEVHEPELLADRIRGASLDVKLLSLEPGVSRTCRSPLQHACLDRVALSSPMWFSGRMAPDCFTLIFILHCPGPAHSLCFQQPFGPGYLGFYAPGGLSEAITPAGYASATLTVPTALFHEALQRSLPDFPETFLKHGHGFKLAQRSFERMNRLLEDFEEMERRDPEWHQSGLVRSNAEMDLIEGYLEALGTGLAINDRRRCAYNKRRFSALRRMRDHITDRRGAGLRLDDLCEVTGMSRRGLEYTCRDLLGTGVNAFLRIHRLQGARSHLLAADPRSVSVKQVALEWGYWHLGRFAREYRQAFGERPSETLAARTRPHPRP